VEKPIHRAQIVATLKELEAGTPATDLARKRACTSIPFELGETSTAGLRRAISFGSSNSRMRKCEESLHARNSSSMRFAGSSKKRLGPSQRKDAVKALRVRGVSPRSACRLIVISERAMQYVARRTQDDRRLIERLKSLASEPAMGLATIVNHDKGRRIRGRRARLLPHLQNVGVACDAKRKRNVRYVRGDVVDAVAAPNARWSMDFMHDRLDNGRPFRLLNVVDDFTAESLAIEPAFLSDRLTSFALSRTSLWSVDFPPSCEPTAVRSFVADECFVGPPIAISRFTSFNPVNRLKMPTSKASTVGFETSCSTRLSSMTSITFEQ